MSYRDYDANPMAYRVVVTTPMSYRGYDANPMSDRVVVTMGLVYVQEVRVIVLPVVLDGVEVCQVQGVQVERIYPSIVLKVGLHQKFHSVVGSR